MTVINNVTRQNLLLLGFGTEKLLLSFKQEASFLQCSLQI